MPSPATLSSRARRTLVPLPTALEGHSAAARRARAAVDLPGAGPLLILVEDGFDPLSIARYVHARSRAARPFVHVDCAQPDAALVEAAILGSCRRAASGDLQTLGAGSALVTARRGTVFLENIGEVSAGVQRGLARLLRDGEARVGRERVRLSARVVASGPPDLVTDARDGRFRGDLLRRFGALPVAIPAIRARPEDLPAIVDRLTRDVAATLHRTPPSFTQAALTVLAALSWPGNLDDLRSTLARVLREVDGNVVRQEDLLTTVPFEGVVRRINPSVSLREARQRFEREYIASVLEQHDWRMSDAARSLGIERANLYRKTRQLGIARGAAVQRARP